MNERIRLEFVEKAERMVNAARWFAVTNPDRRPGVRRGAVWIAGPMRLWLHWTAAGCLVVRELPDVTP